MYVLLMQPGLMYIVLHSPLFYSVRENQVNSQAGVSRQEENKVRTCLAPRPRETTTLKVEEDPKLHPNAGLVPHVPVPKSNGGASRKVRK